nr:hypothetical protein [Tanacetum cinerariifolium]
MTDNSQKAQCKHCFHFLSQGSNTTLRIHITHPHCEVIKAQKNQNPEAGQTSMARDESVFMYDPDYLREQFAGLMCMCLKDHLDAKERKQDKCPLEIPLDFEADVFDDEVQRNKAIPLSDEEIALDASSEGTLSSGGPRYDYMMSSKAEDDY